MVDLKKQYNEKLAKYRKACAYLDNKDIQLDEREKHVTKFRALMYELNGIVQQIGNMTSEQIRNGFEEVIS